MSDRQGINAISKKALSHNTTRLKKRIFIFAMLILPIINWLVFFLYVNIQSIGLAFADPYLLNVEGRWVFTFDNFIKIWDMMTLGKIAKKLVQSHGIRKEYYLQVGICL